MHHLLRKGPQPHGLQGRQATGHQALPPVGPGGSAARGLHQGDGPAGTGQRKGEEGPRGAGPHNHRMGMGGRGKGWTQVNLPQPPFASTAWEVEGG
jgi:hypothetical protein